METKTRLKRVKRVSYQIIVTMRCITSCKWCLQMLDVLPWDQVDTDITVEDVETAGRLLKEGGYRIKWLRITGGEPVLHPRIIEILDTAKQIWRINGRVHVYTYRKYPWKGLIQHDKHKLLSPGYKERRPFRVSPADLGIEPVYGENSLCPQQSGCGHSFQHFGFSFCVLAGPLGELLGENCYEAFPIRKGRRSICQHCLFSLPTPRRFEIQEEVKSGKIKEPTKTYTEGIQRWLDDPPVPLTFQERLVAEGKR